MTCECGDNCRALEAIAKEIKFWKDTFHPVHPITVSIVIDATLLNAKALGCSRQEELETYLTANSSPEAIAGSRLAPSGQ